MDIGDWHSGEGGLGNICVNRGSLQPWEWKKLPREIAKLSMSNR